MFQVEGAGGCIPIEEACLNVAVYPPPKIRNSGVRIERQPFGNRTDRHKQNMPLCSVGLVKYWIRQPTSVRCRETVGTVRHYILLDVAIRQLRPNRRAQIPAPTR